MPPAEEERGGDYRAAGVNIYNVGGVCTYFSALSPVH